MNFRNPTRAIFFAVILVTAGTSAAAFAAETSPLDVRTAVENQLALDPAVSAYKIEVAVHESVVTLDGSVDNLLAKERAAGVAQLVKGVRAVVNQVDVRTPAVRTDKAIRLDIEDAFRVSMAVDDPMDVQADSGVVQLRGTVNSWQERTLCERLAKGIRGVTEVVNLIEVAFDAERSDAEIRADVESRLEWDALVNDGLLEVRVASAKVRLSGTVGSAAEKARAIADAYVSGVQEVDGTGLAVKPWADRERLRAGKSLTKDDAAIHRAVADALLFDPRVSPLTVDVSVSRGRVILDGRVQTLKAKQAAERDARNTVGVVWVENLIEVRPPREITDQKIRQRLQRAFGRDPYLHDEDIRVELHAGIARLSGTVASFFEKAQAEDTASSVGGVLTVENNLRVRDGDRAYAYDPYQDDDYIYVYDHRWHHLKPASQKRADATIEVNLQNQLAWNPLLNEEDIAVAVENGTATLTGTVASWPEYRTATACAFKAGAGWVDNDLRVQ